VLRDRLGDAEIVLLLVTPSWQASQWCWAEASVAWFRQTLVPLHYLPANDPPEVFREIQSVSLADSSGLDSLADRIEKASGGSVRTTRSQWSESRDVFLAFLKERSPDLDDELRAASAGLKVPAQGKSGVLVDLSHGQAHWRSDALFSRDEWTAATGASPDALGIDLRLVESVAEFSSERLRQWSGMLLALPGSSGGPKPKLDSTTIDLVKRWVHAGGRLALLGFELGDRHHGTNLNALAEVFGLRFNADIVAPMEWKASAGKPYGERVCFEVSAEYRDKHALLKGVTTVELANVCTISIEPGGRRLVPLKGLSVGVPRREAVRYDAQGIMSVPGSSFRFFKAPRGAAVALAPAGLSGKGEVVGIGTWDLLCRSANGETQNRLLLRNLLLWLGRRPG
jgi:hypothetical protein